MVINIPLIIYVLTTAGGLILIKLGSATQSIIEIIDGKISFSPNIINILGVLLYGVSFVLYTYLIGKNELGYIIPVTTALVYILVFIASFVVFKEQFTLVKVLAITLIIIGVILLNLKR